MSTTTKVLALTALIVAVTATTALAANVTGDGTLVGTTGSDNIAAGNGNDTIWGLGAPNNGADNISAGYGNDTIDAGGACPPGVQQGRDYPNGLPMGEYCEHGPTPPNCGTANISIAGGGQNGGNDVVYGNCGKNNIAFTKGMGNDTIYLYGGPNNVSVSNGNDTINATGETAGSAKSPNNISTGTGDDVVYAQNGVVDNIACGSKNTVVYADHIDNVSSKCTVKYTAPPAGDPPARHHKAHGATHKAKTHKAKKGARTHNTHTSRAH